MLTVTVHTWCGRVSQMGAFVIQTHAFCFDWMDEADCADETVTMQPLQDAPIIVVSGTPSDYGGFFDGTTLSRHSSTPLNMKIAECESVRETPNFSTFEALSRKSSRRWACFHVQTP